MNISDEKYGKTKHEQLKNALGWNKVVVSQMKQLTFVTPALVFPRNDIGGISAESPYWWRDSLRAVQYFWLVQKMCFIQSEAFLRYGQRRATSMEFLRSLNFPGSVVIYRYKLSWCLKNRQNRQTSIPKPKPRYERHGRKNQFLSVKLWSNYCRGKSLVKFL